MDNFELEACPECGELFPVCDLQAHYEREHAKSVTPKGEDS